MKEFLFQIKANALYKLLKQRTHEISIGFIEDYAWFRKPMMRFMFQLA